MQWVTVRTHPAFWEMASAHRVQLIWPSHTMPLAVAWRKIRKIQHGKRKCCERKLILLAAVSTADISTEDTVCHVSLLDPRLPLCVISLVLSSVTWMAMTNELRTDDACSTIFPHLLWFHAFHCESLIAGLQPAVWVPPLPPANQVCIWQIYPSRPKECPVPTLWPVRTADVAVDRYGPSGLNIGLHTFTIRWTR